MKKLIIISIISLLSCIILQSESWATMTDNQKFQAFTGALQLSDDYKAKYELEKVSFDDLLKKYNDMSIEFTKTNDFLKSYKPFYPKFGFDIGAGIGVDNTLMIDTQIKSGLYFFFDKRFFINPEIYVKPYKNIGGGLSLSIGVLF